MAELLLISDDLVRAERLACGLGASWTCQVVDLYNDTVTTGTPGLIVSDVKVLTSEAFVLLRQLLKRVRGEGVPYLCLLHGSSPRTRVQFDLLGPSSTASASVAIHRLVSDLTCLQNQAEPALATAAQRAGTAQQFLREVFVPGRVLTPDLADVGTEIVASAVREIGIRTWIRTVRRFDDATHQHCLLVAGLAAAFSNTLGLNAIDRHRLARAALLHDVGKIQIPTVILNKPDKLDDAEMAIMRMHPTHGHALLANRGFDEMLLKVVRSHHEMLDGSGYPDKLAGSDIPDLVRLVTICDIYGALIERRPYRAPTPAIQAYGILEGMKGRLDADLVRAFHPIADTCPSSEAVGVA